MKRLLTLILTLAAAMAPSPVPARAAGCARCHQNPAMKPSLKDAVGVPRSLYIDPVAFENSWHYKLGKKTECASCHHGKDTFPHKPERPLLCSNCHEKDNKKQLFLDIESTLKKSVHARLDCNDCHDVHRNKPAAAMTLAEKNAGCLKCHRFGPMPENEAMADPLPLEVYHSWHPEAALHLARMACIVCHTSMTDGKAADKHLILDKSHATRQCATCHSGDSKIAAYLIDVGPGPKEGMDRKQLLNRIYLVGWTRMRPIELAGSSMLALTVLGALGHGAGRVFASRRRKKK